MPDASLTHATHLLSPLTVGELRLKNRVVMSPMTRARAGTTHVPNLLMAEYYSQRAGAGLIVTECTMVAPSASAFIAEGGLYDDATEAGWRQVVDAVHAAGGLIALQIWHPGRATHWAINGGAEVVSAGGSAIAGETHTPEGKKAYPVPRKLETDEIPAFVEMFRQTARRAKAAGFDAIEVHGANGYLVDQFLRDGTNKRTDSYGGSQENRLRFLLDVTDACIEAFGPGRTGVRISPTGGFNAMHNSDPVGLTRGVCRALSQRGVAFLDLKLEFPRLAADEEVAKAARADFTSGTLMLNGGYTPETAEQAIASGVADAVLFATLFIANPDLPARIAAGAALAKADPQTFYSGGEHGYTDYPALKAV